MNDVTIFNDDSVTVSGPRKSVLKDTFSSPFTSRRIQANINGTFRRIVNGEHIGDAVRGDIEVIVLNALSRPSRIFYKEAYDPKKEATLPNCWSNEGDKPEDGVSDKQNDLCISCAQNIKGSGDNGGRACRYQRRVAVLLAGDDSGDIYQLNIPAKSLFEKSSGKTHAFEHYTRFITANNEALDNVVTKVSFEANSSTMKLVFSAERIITDEEYELVKTARTKPEFALYTRLTVAQTDKVTALPAEETKVEAEEPEAEAVPEPTKRKKQKAAAPAAPKKQKIVSELDDWE